jgi:hypothetical protein
MTSLVLQFYMLHHRIQYITGESRYCLTHLSQLDLLQSKMIIFVKTNLNYFSYNQNAASKSDFVSYNHTP